MPVAWNELQMAFEFLASAPPEENRAILDCETGTLYYESGYGDGDEMPEDVDDNERYVPVPHRKELDLGIRLVRTFAAANLPRAADKVERIFSQAGAYRRWKHFLGKQRLLDRWHAFEQKAMEEALLAWCADNGVEVTGRDVPEPGSASDEDT